MLKRERTAVISTSNRSVLFVLSALAAIIALGVSAYSLINPDVYRSSVPQTLLPGAFSQDAVSLLVALSLLLCIYFIRSGRQMIWLVWVGLLGYLFYAYALYSFDRVYNLLFLFYIAILGLAVYALIGFFRYSDLSCICIKEGPRQPPRKAVAVLFLLLAALFATLWLNIVIPAMVSKVPPEGNSILVMDLSFVLPLLAVEARLLLKKAPLGDVLAIPLLIKAGSLGLSVFVGTLIAPLFGQAIAPASVALYALLGFGPLALIMPFLSALTVSQTKAPSS